MVKKKRRMIQRKSRPLMLVSGMMATTTQVGSNLPGRAQAQVGKILSGLSGAIGTPRISTKTQMIGGTTAQAEEKMT